MLAITVIANIINEVYVKLFCFLMLLFFLIQSQLVSSNQISHNKTSLNKNWLIYPSSKIKLTGKEISSSKITFSNWYETDIPKTVLAALVENKVYKDIYFGKNLENIPTEQFKSSWWYRKEFKIESIAFDEFHLLKFLGINYKADIWLNGNKVASKENIEGAFGMFELNISEYIKQGSNVLAIEVFPPKYGDLTIGFVDWNPSPPDNNMGLWRGVELTKVKTVELKDVFIKPNLNLETLKQANLDITSTVVNHSTSEIAVTVEGKIGEIGFKKEIKLKGKETRSIEFSSRDYEQLVFKNPKIWWPNNFGEQPLYNLELSTYTENEIYTKENIKFGIREVEDYINKDGYRGYKINGKPIVIKGAGWVDDLLLNDSDEKVINQIKYAKHMNLNTIRLEGFWGKNKTLYETADENGILLMIGWSCQWEWKGYCGREETKYMCIDTPKDMELQVKAYGAQVKWLRNHPSIFLWVYGSDKLPSPELEKKLDAYIPKLDPTRPILKSCKSKDFGGDSFYSEISGSPRVKMLGPYAYETPNYWYLADTIGGAWGFNTETGPGPQIPPLESLKKMIPENELWPINNSWEYHLGRNEFQTLDRYEEAFNHRYGKANSALEFTAKSQISNYEAMRPMFEAFSVNKNKATGVIQWMFNSAWPEMFWQLFDYYLMPNGAFYGAKKGCQPLNLVYNYKDKNIYLVNDHYENFENLRAELKILNSNSEIIYEEKKTVNIIENFSKKVIEIPEKLDFTKLYFVALELFNGKDEKVSDNFYWLSSKEDVLDFDNSDWYYTPLKFFADFTDINQLPKTEISYKVLKQDGNKIKIKIKNESDKVAFFIDVRVLNEETNNSFLPVFISDNYFSLLPGKSKVISGSFNNNNDVKSKIEVKGWNTELKQ